MKLLQIFGGCGASTDMAAIALLQIWSFCRDGGYGFSADMELLQMWRLWILCRYGGYGGASAEMEAVELLMAMELRPFSSASLPSVR
jgi:hypothetical protein